MTTIIKTITNYFENYNRESKIALPEARINSKKEIILIRTVVYLKSLTRDANKI